MNAAAELATAEFESSAPATNNAPVFVLAVARSGSTLLRFILDAHPELTCPPETGVAGACAQLSRVWSVLEGVPGAGAGNGIEAEHVTERSAQGIREAIDAALVPYMRARGKRRWCDKSLDTTNCLDLVARIWPDAKFICLYRHAMDMIASGLEASRWALDSFGFERHAAQYPGNNVAAVGAHWADHVTRMINFEKSYPDRTLRVRYEDVVMDAEGSAARIFSFLGVSHVQGISSTCFTSPHDANGPSDPKIWFTNKISSSSLGRGLEIPVKHLPGHLRAEINGALSELGYLQVEDDWGARRMGRNIPLTVTSPDAAATAEVANVAQASDPVGSSAGPEGAVSELEEIVDEHLESVAAAMEVRDHAISPEVLAAIVRSWPGLAGRVLGTDLHGPAGGFAQFRWDLPGDPLASSLGASGDEHPDLGSVPETVVAGPSFIWQAIMDDKMNLWTELYLERMIVRGPVTQDRGRPPEVHAIGVLLGLAQLPDVKREGADGDHPVPEPLSPA
jgi:hypothetical protein